MNASELIVDELLMDLNRIVHDSEELLRATEDSEGHKSHELRERITNGLNAARRTCRRLEAKAIARAKAADNAIRQHPYQSIGIAFGVGVLIGLVVTRK